MVKQQKEIVDRFVNKCSKVVTVSDEYSRHLNMPHEKYRIYVHVILEEIMILLDVHPVILALESPTVSKKDSSVSL